MNLKQKLDALMLKKGNTRGEVFKNFASCISEKEGNEAVIKVEEKAKELGYPFKFSEFKPLEWYPEAYSGLIMNILVRLGWTEDDIFNLGKTVSKHSLVLKILMKHFASLERVLREAPNSWGRYFDFAELDVLNYDKDNNRISLRLRGYEIDPLMCVYLSGYFIKIAELSIGNKKITIKEEKCIHKGDPFHEFLISW